MPSLRRVIRRVLSDQRGQDMVDYGGTLLIVALIVAAMAVLAVRSLGPTVAQDIVCLVQKIVGQGGCAAGAAYPVSASVKTVGYNGRVAFVDGSHGYQITLTKLSNGSSTITVVDTGKLGVSAEASAGLDLGPLAGADAQASIGGGGYGDHRYTWTFPTWAQGQSYYNKISQGNSLGLGAHDVVSSTAGSIPFIGGGITHTFDSITGASGAPGQGSLPTKDLTSTSDGGGLQGKGEANANVNLGSQSGVGATINANVGVEHINYGAQKGDWQLVAGLSGTADAALGGVLFGGGQANVAGNMQAQATVTYAPNGTPLTLQIVASGDGVWGVSPPQSFKLKAPVSSSTASGTPDQGGAGGEGGGAAKPPTLTIKTNGTGGSGVGTSFIGTLDLSNDPQAQQDVEGFLQGDLSRLGDLISQLNSNGTESIQTYHIDRSNTTYGAKLSAGVGVGAGTNDGGSNATYDPPTTREKGGPWHTAGH